jgi:hypothetical protein
MFFVSIALGKASYSGICVVSVAGIRADMKNRWMFVNTSVSRITNVALFAGADWCVIS